MKAKIIFLLAFFCISFFSFGQGSGPRTNKDFATYHKMTSFNMSPLAKSLIPFNASPALNQPYAMEYRKTKNGRVFSVIGFGLDLSPLFRDAIDEFHFNFKAGTEIKHPLSSSWNFYSGYNIALFAEGIEGDFFDDVNAGMAFDKSFMIEYSINDRLSLHTETSFQLGISSISIIWLELVPPTSLFLNVKFQ